MDVQSPDSPNLLDSNDISALQKHFGHDSKLLAVLKSQVDANRDVSRKLVIQGLQQGEHQHLDELEQRVNLVWTENRFDEDLKPLNGSKLFLGTRDIVDKGVWWKDKANGSENAILNIQSVLNCAAAPEGTDKDDPKIKRRYVQKPTDLPDGMYMEIHLEDAAMPMQVGDLDLAIGDYFIAATDFIESHLQIGNSNVFIHCCGGVSRSATLTLAYLIRKKKLRLRDAFQYLKLQRPQIGPNGGFMMALSELEKDVFDGVSTLLIPEDGLTHDQRDFKFVEPMKNESANP